MSLVEARDSIGVIVESSLKRTLSEFNHYISKLRKYPIGRLFGFGATKSAFFVAKPGIPVTVHSIRPARPWRRAAWQLERVASFGKNASVTQLPAKGR